MSSGAVTNIVPERRRQLERAGVLHWFHWVIIALSFGLTLFAWYYSKSQTEQKFHARFDREAQQAVELVVERMQRYEDALNGGVAFIRTHGGDVNFNEWRDYARNIRIEEKYSGINGMGVIHALPRQDAEPYLETQRTIRPGFQIHPEHSNDELWPIAYIVPVKGNDKAVGLDMAHETNRYTAAKKARDTGNPQITGPITLVQDAEHTPGFLFYAPIYEHNDLQSVAERRQQFKGLVYAPFVMKKLMEGTLEKSKRHVGLRIDDGDEVLYDEHNTMEDDYDPNPLFTKTVNLQMYGRPWKFEIWSAKSFRAAASSREPLTILIGGFIIDGFLIVLFLMISRASRKALQYADEMTHELAERSDELAKATEVLEESNVELQQFAYVASHDLQTPLRAISSFAHLLQLDYKGKFDERADDYLNRMMAGAARMKQLIDDLLEYSQVESRSLPFDDVCLNDVFDDAVLLIESEIAATAGAVTKSDLPCVRGDRRQITQLFQNLIANGVKYHGTSPPEVRVTAESKDEEWIISVTDNGIGMAKKHQENIFQVFKRLHTQEEYPGTGIGLAVCRRIVGRHQGRLWVTSDVGKGSTFFVALPKNSRQLQESQSG